MNPSDLHNMFIQSSTIVHNITKVYKNSNKKLQKLRILVLYQIQ